MTIKKLSRYFYINKQITALKERIEEIETTIIGSSKITGMPIHHNNQENPIEIRVEKLINLKNKLNQQLDKLLEEETMIQDFINDIDDIKIQAIVRLRFIDLKHWEEIANVLHYSRVAPYLQLKEYLKKYNQKSKEEVKQ